MKATILPLRSITIATLAALLNIGAAQAQDEDFASLDLMELMKVELVSSSKFKQELSDVAASAYVITAEDIRDSGASNLPELLSMVPGLSGNQSSANSWAMGIRGFNSVFSNKVLVMIDGRSLFSPLFSGVFWEQVDLYLPDIERIEVIRGVGSTVWGANAVNGVINIITKSTLDNENTQLYVKSGDSVNIDAGVRFGTQVTDTSYARFYAKSKDMDSNQYAVPGIDDSWQSHAVGGKWELFSGRDSVSVSGDWIEQKTLETALITARMTMPQVALDNRTSNLSVQWQRQISTDKAFTLAAQTQQTTRKGNQYRIDDDMLNLDLDGSVQLNDHAFVFGLGVRYHKINFLPGTAFSFTGSSEVTQTDAKIYSVYLQDQWQLAPGHHLQIGTKFEAHRHERATQNDYNQDLWLPTLRYRMDISEKSRLWLALSSSARIPSISEQFLQIPIYAIPPFTELNPTPWPFEMRSVGNDNFEKEDVHSLEVGFRSNINASNRIDAVWFHNRYEGARAFRLQQPVCVNSGQPVPLCAEVDSIFQPNTFENGGDVETTGFELSWQSRLTSDLSVSASYSWLNQNISPLPGIVFEDATYITPKHQLATQIDWHLANNWNFHLQHKFVSGIDDSNTTIVQFMPDFLDHYHMLDLNVSYDFAEHYRVMLGVDNLLDENGNQWTPEFPSSNTSLLERRVFVGLDVTY